MKLYTLDNEFIEETDSFPLNKNFTGIIELHNGDKYWHLNDKLHRTDGPACEYVNGDKKWYLNDKLHRLDGPAMEFPNGEKYYYIKNEQVSEEQHKLLVNIMKLKNLTLNI